ncbi:YihY/virulence factor BrkB family protein, partial [Xanthovirga aplysinae]|uniref:YihY/virulence factor BrkB family protein n=1 Tax=Xanthovirga aplysinae TaxID=2529853 RepID=UPI001656E705
TSCIYYFAPKILHRTFFSPGSILATLLTLGISFVFSYYLNNFGAYNKLYGSIGVLIAIMIWFYILSLVLLLGFELNASIDKALSDYRRKLVKGNRKDEGNK